MLAVVALTCHRKPFSIVTDIYIEYANAKREGVDGLDILQVAVEADDSLRTAVREQTVDTIVRVVVDDVVDTLVFFLLYYFILLDVVDFKTTHLCVVRCVDDALRIAVECYECRVVELYAVDVAKLALLFCLQVDLSEMCKSLSRGVHSGVSLACIGIVDKRRYRS